MRGIIQFINVAKHSGVLLAKDGSSYSFTVFDCVPGTQPRVGDIVEFDVLDGVAVEIRGSGSKGSEAPPLNLNSIRESMRTPTLAASLAVSDYPPMEQPRRVMRQQGTPSPLRRLGDDWRNVLAALALVASLLPFVSYMTVSSNLFGTVSFAGHGIDTLAQLRDATQKLTMSAAPQGFPGMGAQQARQIDQVSAIVWGLRSSYLLLMIPLTAALTLAAAFKGRDNSKPALFLGATCLSLPLFALVADYAVSTFKDQMAMGMGQFMPSAISMLGIGFYLLTAIGLAMLLVQFRIIGRQPPSAYLAAHA